MHCELFAFSKSFHTSQLYTGFSILEKKGEIKLKQKFKDKHIESLFNEIPNSRKNYYAGLFVVINDKLKVYYDVKDAGYLDVAFLEYTDLYFKRSYDLRVIPERYSSKVFPLGLNYPVYTNYIDIKEIQRRALIGGISKNNGIEALKYIIKSSINQFSPTVKEIEAKPNYNSEPRILFNVRAWDPDTEPEGLPEEKKDERRKINQVRADCITLLRKEFGKKFTGGFTRTNFALRNYKDQVLNEEIPVDKKSYIKMLKNYPICIATTGLHGSIGWKMGEYTAVSKAIISEKLNYELPGNYRAGHNYLEFYDPEKCVNQVQIVFQDKRLRNQIMQNNHEYYWSFLRPDVLIKNTLSRIID